MARIPVMDFDVFPPFKGFPQEGIQLLKRLKQNNNREWFEKHREEFLNHVKEPMQSFIVALQVYFSRFSPEFDLNPARSIFRIYRDIRFSPDKTPYKTHIAAHFVLRGKPKGFVGSGYYIEVNTEEVYIGGGIYIPDSGQLKKIRKAIAGRGKEFLAIVENRNFKKSFAPFNWNKLKRIPKGYDEDHPMAEWLKHKQFFVGVSWPVTKCYKTSFAKEAAAICEKVTPLVKFLTARFKYVLNLK